MYLLISTLLLVFSAVTFAEDSLSEKSEAELEAALQESPGNMGIYYELARSYLGLRSPVLKEQLATDGLEASTTFYNLALSQLEKGESAQALRQLRTSIKADESNIAAYILLAQTYADLRVPRAAEFYLREAMERGASDSQVLVPLGEALLAQEKFEEVLQDIQLSGLPKHLESSVRLLHSRAYMSLQEFEQASRILNEVLEEDKNNPGALIELARLAMIRGEPELAGDYLDRVKKSGRYSPEYWLVKGEQSRTDDDMEMAQSSFESALKLKEDHLLALHAIAALLIERGDISAAEKHVQQLRTFYPLDLRGILFALTIARSENRQVEFEALRIIAKDLIEEVDYIALQDDQQNLLLIGTIHSVLNEPNEASALLSRYLELNPRSFRAVLLLVSSHLIRGNPNAASEVLRQSEPYMAGSIPWEKLSAEVMIQQKNYESAILMLMQVVDKSPEDVATQVKIARLRSITGQVGQAVQSLSALREETDDLAPDLLLADILLAAGQFDAVQEIISELRGIQGDSTDLLHLEARVFQGKGQVEQARQTWQKALVAEPESALVLYNLAVLEAREGDLASAKSGFEKLLEIDSDHVRGHLQLASIAEKQGNMALAISHQKLAVRLKPSVAEGLRLISLLKSEGRQMDENAALQDLRVNFPYDLNVMAYDAHESILRSDPDRTGLIYARMGRVALNNESIPDLVRVSLLYQQMGDAGEAKKMLDQAAAIDPDSRILLVAQTEAALRAKEFSLADTFCGRVLELYPNDPVGFRLSGDLHALRGHPEQALKTYREGLSLTGGDSVLTARYFAVLREQEGTQTAVTFLESWLLNNRTNNYVLLRALASAHSELGNTDKAIEMNEVLLASRDDDPVLLNNLALLYLKVGDDRALAYAERAAELASRNVAMMDTLGWVQVNLGDMNVGIAVLRNASLSSDVPEIRYHYAWALHRNGQLKAAKRELQALLLQGGEFSDRAAAEALYDELVAE